MANTTINQLKQAAILSDTGLLPCPMCGEDAMAYIANEEFKREGCAFCPVCGLTIHAETKEQAITLWNTRTISANAVKEELERVRDWQPIETAPKDGSLILLLSAPYDDDVFGETVHHPAKVALGYWNPEGTAWVDERGRTGGDAYELAQTGIWNSGGGWFEPDEVTHWLPLPASPGASGTEGGDGE